MKKQLIKISSDEQPLIIDCPGPYKDDNGNRLHGIYLRKNKLTIDKLFISNGNLIRKYKYPRIEEQFSSPMISDYNLHLCGGWSWQGVKYQESITRVVEGKKPMGFFSSRSSSEIDNLFENIKHGIKKQDFKLIKTTSTIPGTDIQFYELGISTTKLFVDCFNLGALKTDYKQYANACNVPSNSIIEFIDLIKDNSISSFLQDYDYANPITNLNTILTGLILGYPINTTVSILWL